MSVSDDSPSFQLTVNCCPCYAPAAEKAYEEIPKVSQRLSARTVTGWEKPISGERKFQRFLRACCTKSVRLWAKPVSGKISTPNISWSYYLCEQVFFNLFSNLSFIFVHGITTYKDFFLPHQNRTCYLKESKP